jgi:hypothetical protein
MEKEILAREITNWLIQRPYRDRLISNNGMDTYGLGIMDKLINWQLSSRASDAVMELAATLPVNATRADLNKAFRQILHPEHNVPVKVKKQELMHLANPDFKIVRKALEMEYEVILITKQEASVLNGRRKSSYVLDNQMVRGCGLSSSGSYTERLEAISAVLLPESAQKNLIQYLRGRFANL